MAGALLLLTSRLYWLDLLPPPWLPALFLLTTGAALGALFGTLRPVLEPRELALLLDRALGTDEVLITLMHLEEIGSAPESVRTDLEQRVADLPRVESGLVHRAPRTAIWLFPALLLAALLLLLPIGALVPPPTNPMSAEAERLNEALSEVREHLPPDLQRDIDTLVEQLQQGELTPEQAEERLREIQHAIESFEEGMSDGQADLDAIRGAAEAMAEGGLSDDLQEAVNEVAEALEEQDLQAAGEAAEAVADQIQSASAEDQQRLSEQLQQAADALQGASSEALQDLASSLQEAAQDLAKASESSGQAAEEAAAQAADKLREAKEKAEQNRELAERLRRDREQLQQSQKANGALEASRQRLGGEPETGDGECQGGGQQGGLGEPQTGLDSAIGEQGEASAGTGHTWEDEGTFDTVGGHQDADRQSDRSEGRVANDFESYYDPARLAGAEGLITSVEGRIDTQGSFDTEVRRLTFGEEQATRQRVDVPDAYIEAAERALADDRVPPGYRAAIRDYFDSME